MSKKRQFVSISLYWKVVIILFALAAILNILAWSSKSFCDAYIMYVFPIWGKLYGCITGLTSVSVGEIMIYLAAVLLLLGIIALVALLIIKVTGRDNKPALALKTYLKIIMFVVALESVIMTLNCFILYHCSTFSQKYMSEAYHTSQYTVEELAEVRELVIVRANKLAELMQRDDAGNIIYDGDMASLSVKEMKKLGEIYPQLSGYYSYPKAFAASEFFSQQYMMGYYFPFSMEANYNDVMYITNIPSTMCHELAHTKGFIYEDEANLIGFLACVHSDDIFFEYSGYLSVLSYLNNDLLESVGKNKAIYAQYAQPSELVIHDRVFLTEDAWEKVEEKAILDTDAVKEASTKFIDTNLKVNGIEQGEAMYSEVVGYLIDYYMSGIDDRFCKK